MRCVEMTRLMRGTNHLVAQKVLCAFRIQQMSIPTVHFFSDVNRLGFQLQ